MGVGIRQSMLQGWCGFVSTTIIYLYGLLYSVLYIIHSL